jgi:hypothetical protein
LRCNTGGRNDGLFHHFGRLVSRANGSTEFILYARRREAKAAA